MSCRVRVKEVRAWRGRKREVDRERGGNGGLSWIVGGMHGEEREIRLW